MSEIRSVSVHLDADVASYVAKMRLAGAETDKAFGRSSAGIDSTNSSLGRTATTLDKVDVSARKVETSMSRVGSTSRSGARDVDLFGSRLGGMTAAAIAGTSALVPLAGAAAGVVAAFAAPVAFVGGGLTLFGVLDGFAISKTNKQIKTIDDLKTKLAGLKKGTADYAVVAHQLQIAQDALTPAQRDYADSLDHLHTSFDHLLGGKSGDALLGPIAQGLDLAAELLPKVEPIITAVSGGLTTLLGDLDDFSRTNEFSAFVHDVSSQIGPDLVAGGRILGDFTEGVGHLLVLTGKRLSPELLHGLENIADDFSAWATSKGARHDVQSFLQYLHEVGPDVASTIASVARGLTHTVEALAPLGPPTLAVVKGIADAISGIPTPTLTALAGATVGLVALSKTSKGISALSGGVGTLTGGRGIAGGLIGATRPVPVFVTNPGFGGPGGPGGAAGKTAAGTVAGEAAAGLGAAGIVARFGGAVARFGEIIGAPAFVALNAEGGQHAVPGGTSPNYGTQFVIPPSGKLPTRLPGMADIKAVGTAVEALNARLAKTSSGIDLVGHSADRAFPSSAKEVTDLAARVDRVNGARAAQALDVVGHSASANFARAGGDVDTFHGKLDRVDGTHAARAIGSVGQAAKTSLSQASGGVDTLHGKLNALPANKKVAVSADTGPALGALRAVAAELASIRSKTITLTTVRTTGGHSVGGNAEGGTIPGPRYPYGDKVLRLVAPGEEIISNRFGQADRWRPVLKRINADGMADGGTVPTHVTTTASGLVMGGDGVGAAARSVTHELHGLRLELHNVTLQSQDLGKAIDAEKQKRDAIVQAEQQLASTVADNFRSQVFGVTPDTSGGIWMSGRMQSTDPARILRQNIRDAREYTRDLRRLRRRGLRGGALAEVDTLDEAQQALHLSRREDHQISRLFDIRQRASQAAGGVAAQFRFGHQLGAVRDEIQHTNHQLHEANQRLHKVETAIKHHEAEQKKNHEHSSAAQAKSLQRTAARASRRART